MSERFKVSACIITYNHQRFIDQCLRGAVNQIVNFDYEILIGDDHSTDNTLSICERYAMRYPLLIKLKTQSKNLGMAGNWIDTLKRSDAKYIAICEGDDFWTDPLKLQKQVDFLEANTDYVICGHDVNIINHSKLNLSPDKGPSMKDSFTIVDLAKANILCTVSVVFRNRPNDLFPKWFNHTPICDYPLHMLNARFGKIKNIPEVMGIYREHIGGVWAGVSSLKRNEKLLTTIDLLFQEFSDPEIVRQLKNQKHNAMNAYLKDLIYSDIDAFTNQLKIFVEQDPSLVSEWLLYHYPAHLSFITSAASYKLARHISKTAQKIKKFIKI